MAVNRDELAKQIFKAPRAEYGMLAAGSFAYDEDSGQLRSEGAKSCSPRPAERHRDRVDIFDYGWGEQWEKWVQRDLKRSASRQVEQDGVDQLSANGCRAYAERPPWTRWAGAGRCRYGPRS
jgi:hypothetical protein